MRRYLIPPVWFLLGIACELVLARRAPIAPVLPPPLHWIGAVVIVAGFVITNWAVIWFKRKKTGLLPFTPTTALVVEGPYRFTRNPDYLGIALVLTGLALWLGVASPLLVPPVIVAVIHHMFVLPEEAHMERAMGSEYLAYKSRPSLALTATSVPS